MQDVQINSAADKPAFTAPPTPELDERLWLAWKAKNRAKDVVRAANRKRVLTLLVAAGVVAVIALRMYGA